MPWRADVMTKSSVYLSWPLTNRTVCFPSMFYPTPLVSPLDRQVISYSLQTPSVCLPFGPRSVCDLSSIRPNRPPVRSIKECSSTSPVPQLFRKDTDCTTVFLTVGTLSFMCRHRPFIETRTSHLVN